MGAKQQLTVEDRVLTLEYGQEKTERHYSELKDKVDTVSDNVKDIKNAVVGNAMNGNSGMAHDLRKNKTDIYDLQVVTIKHELYFKQMAVVLGILFAGLITALIKIFI
jgi:hypothetical protein